MKVQLSLSFAKIPPTPVSVGVAADVLGVHPQTIRAWADGGKIKCSRTPSGQRRILLPETPTESDFSSTKKDTFGAVYCRVSSPKQKDDLQRQVAHMQKLYPKYKVYTDVGSGINFKRKALLSLLDAALQGMVSEVVVASRDRLCRFAFELLEWIFSRGNTKVTVLQQTDASPESELSDDVLSIIQVLCCRRNGRRRYSGVESLVSQGGHENDQIEVDNDSAPKARSPLMGGSV